MRATSGPAGSVPGSSNDDRVRTLAGAAVVVVILVLVVAWWLFVPHRGSETIKNVSFDVTRELFGDINAAYTARLDAEGEVVSITMSHGGSVQQVGSLVRGLEADVVTLASRHDLDALSATGLIDGNWRQAFPHDSSPFSSTIVFLVQAGNPKGVGDWADLIRDDVQATAPNPLVSGAGRWAYLAAWGWMQSIDSDRAAEFVTGLYSRLRLVNQGARQALRTYEGTGDSDVFLTWESDAWYAVNAYGRERFSVVYPSASILAEPVVAVVDPSVGRRGTRESATRYLSFLFEEEGQELVAQHHFRPRHEETRQRHQEKFANIPLFSVEEVFGSWDQAYEAHFRPGGTFDLISRQRP